MHRQALAFGFVVRGRGRYSDPGGRPGKPGSEYRPRPRLGCRTPRSRGRSTDPGHDLEQFQPQIQGRSTDPGHDLGDSNPRSRGRSTDPGHDLGRFQPQDLEVDDVAGSRSQERGERQRPAFLRTRLRVCEEFRISYEVEHPEMDCAAPVSCAMNQEVYP